MKRKLKFTNETPYDGRAIKRLARAVAGHHRMLADWQALGELNVINGKAGSTPKIKTGRTTSREGWNVGTLTLTLPRPGSEAFLVNQVVRKITGNRPRHRFAAVQDVARQFGRGLYMAGNAKNWNGLHDFRPKFGDYLPVRTTKPKAKPAKDSVQLARYRRVLAREKAWTAKLKRAETALKKLRKTRKYYESQGVA